MNFALISLTVFYFEGNNRILASILITVFCFDMYFIRWMYFAYLHFSFYPQSFETSSWTNSHFYIHDFFVTIILLFSFATLIRRKLIVRMTDAVMLTKLQLFFTSLFILNYNQIDCNYTTEANEAFTKSKEPLAKAIYIYKYIYIYIIYTCLIEKNGAFIVYYLFSCVLIFPN